MASSPGHRKWPEHQVLEVQEGLRIEVLVNDVEIAESNRAVTVKETQHPDRYYIPREDIKMDLLEVSEKTTECPFKGTATYFSIFIDDHEIPDAAWSYEEPYDEHRGLEGKIAFDKDKVDELKVSR